MQSKISKYFSGLYVPPSSIDRFQKEIIEGAEKRLYEFAEEHFNAFPETKTVVAAGDPSEEIIKYIHDQHIDLVIMGTHGRKGMDKIFFGSVADRIVKTAPVPVMVVNPFRVDD